MLSFQRLDVYRCAIDLVAFTASIELPRGLAHLADQLRRAALSVPLNISLRVLAVLDERRHAHGIELVSRMVAMSTQLCR